MLCVCPMFGAVSVSSPANGGTYVSPVKFTATATTPCYKGVASMGIYINNSLKYTVQGHSLNTSVTLTPGSYYAVVQEWDYCGGATKTPLNITVVQPWVDFGAVSVASPTPGQLVTSPFLLSATDATCEGQPVSTLAYSLDGDGTLLGLTNSQVLNTPVTATVGQHTLHVKSWGPNYAACATDVTANVVTPATAIIPSTATVTNNIQSFLNWKGQYDPGTSGSATGAMGLVTSPSLSGAARQFITTYTNNGGFLYYDNFAQGTPDTTSHNWFVDLYIHVASPSTDIANIEIDMNQVDPSGNTVIMGFQCDGWGGNATWDYTYTDSSTHWLHSAQHCKPTEWTTDVWHHVQIWFSRDDQDNITYHSVWFDNQEQDINATVLSKLPLGWADSNILNFQIDGYGSQGGMTVYADNITVYRW